MGGAAPEPTSKGGKKPLDAAINLVPYIDMLMTIMTFLMMTAVWTQIAMLEVQNASGGPEQTEPEQPPPDKPKPILIVVTGTGIKVGEEGAEITEFAKGATHDFTNLAAKLKQLHDARPDRIEVKIQSEDSAVYSDIVKIIDISSGLNMKAITLTPTGA